LRGLNRGSTARRGFYTPTSCSQWLPFTDVMRFAASTLLKQAEDATWGFLVAFALLRAQRKIQWEQ
ncbi:hypothetical protein, partial [Bordetella tumbae]|uniref:hypothetical protein n=1 Tax=Bordetella tumbae TaxID=1649139 RepID=UPI0039EF9D47